jgi:hypothetical protein
MSYRRLINKKTFSIKDFNEERAQIMRNAGTPSFIFLDSFYDEHRFKRIRDSFVEESINKLGVIFFSFEYVEVTQNPEEVKFLTSLYSNNRFLNPNHMSDFFLKTVQPRVVELLDIRGFNPQGSEYRPANESNCPGLSEFVYFTLSKERPNVEALANYSG